MKKIAFIGGGSGGHIMPIVAIYNALKHEPDMSFVWIGEKGAMDETKAREYEIPFRGIISDKFRRYFSLRSIIAPFKIALGFIQAFFVLRQEKPDVIFSKGGPVSFPVGAAAWLLGIPLSLHESDTIPGLANRVSARFATKIFLGFAEARKFFDIPKTQVVGQILDPVFEEYLETAGLPLLPVGDRTKVLVFCGSQGSTMIFEKILTILDRFPQVDFTVVLGMLNTHLHEKFE
ncbi:MAG: UDP-N-acetylglucosamine--N-acetylmuramyl-(pentapeptide) pyrophosphoryl-undecaprenol N-acetylglucosamine transferase [Patescibacteria group bacterium]